jgi:hypothetical protein
VAEFTPENTSPSPEEQELSKQLSQEFQELETERHNWESYWQDIAEHMIPRRADFNASYAPGEKRRNKIFEGTAVRALTRFASGLHNTLTNAQTSWFQLTVPRPLMQDRDVQLWLEESQRLVIEVFNRPISNFHPASHEFYLDLGAFGTGVMMVYDEPGQGPMFRTFHLGECFLQMNHLGRVDTVYRKFEHTAKALVEQFGIEVLPESVSKSYMEGNPYKKFSCLHVVKPRKDRNFGEAGSMNMPWMSVYMLHDQKRILSVSGYDQFPYVCSRWERQAQEIYGRGPGIEALADVRMLNKMEELGLKSLAKMVDPPLLVPDDGFLSPIRTTPGGLNYFRAGLGPNDRIMPLETRGRPDLNEAKMGQVRDAINRSFYLDLLELPGPTAPDGDVLRFSATEIMQRQRDRLSVLGPIVSRQEVEFLGPLVDRTLTIMVKNQMLPPPPEVLIEADFQVEYTNPVGIAQRAGEMTSVSALIQFLTPMAQIDPSVLRRIDPARVATIAAEILRVPPSVFKTEEEFAAEMEAEAQQMAMNTQMQEQMAVAQADNLVSMADRNRSQASLNLAKAEETA